MGDFGRDFLSEVRKARVLKGKYAAESLGELVKTHILPSTTLRDVDSVCLRQNVRIFFPKMFPCDADSATSGLTL